jgi:hypothetical protein
VAPDRIQRGRSLTRPPGLMAGAVASIDPALAEQMRKAWETLNNRWNQWVLNYAQGQQLDLLRALGLAQPSWQDLLSLLTVLLCTAALAAAGWAWWDRRRQDPWQRLQRRVLTTLQALGVPALPHHGPRTRATLVRQALGGAGEGLARQLDALDASRYGQAQASTPGRAWWRQFAAAARQARTGSAANPGTSGQS